MHAAHTPACLDRPPVVSPGQSGRDPGHLTHGRLQGTYNKRLIQTGRAQLSLSFRGSASGDGLNKSLQTVCLALQPSLLLLVYALKNAPDRLYCQVIVLEVYENYESLSDVSANPWIFSSRDFDIFRTIKQLHAAVKEFFLEVHLEVHYVLDRYHQPIYIANLEYLGRFK
jgi:hypothetical protein